MFKDSGGNRSTAAVSILVHDPMHEAVHDIHRVVRRADRLAPGITQPDDPLGAAAEQLQHLYFFSDVHIAGTRHRSHRIFDLASA
jgi:hypothetical protein